MVRVVEGEDVQTLRLVLTVHLDGECWLDGGSTHGEPSFHDERVEAGCAGKGDGVG